MADINITLADGSIDQQNTTGTTGIGFGDVGSGRDYLGQGFTAGFDSINAIAFYLVGKSGTGKVIKSGLITQMQASSPQVQ